MVRLPLGGLVSLPEFKYHPDPISTGSIKASSAACDCCGQSRGYEYTASFYSPYRGRLKLCPWCIGSGDAAKKYDGAFSDDYPLAMAGVTEEIRHEVCEQTPGYNSWQQEVWQCHCNDACEYHGDAEPAELRALSGGQLAQILNQNGLNEGHWRNLIDGYEKGGNPAVHKFVCRHCGTSIYTLDFT